MPGSGRSPGGGRGNPLQYSCLEKPKDRGAWRATVQGVVKNRTCLKRLSTTNNLWGQTEEIVTKVISDEARVTW